MRQHATRSSIQQYSLDVLHTDIGALDSNPSMHYSDVFITTSPFHRCLTPEEPVSDKTLWLYTRVPNAANTIGEQ